MAAVSLTDYLAALPSTLAQALAEIAPWNATTNAPEIIAGLALDSGVYREAAQGVRIHESATVEQGAVLKPPIVIGPRAFVAAGAYLRGGIFLDEDVIVGPYCELKTVFMLKGSKVAHLSFVGDSLIGARANIEAGAVIANYRNERDDKHIRIADGDIVHETGVDKFGALVGDNARIGANATIAPGALIKAGAVIRRGALIDQHPQSQH